MRAKQSPDDMEPLLIEDFELRGRDVTLRPLRADDAEALAAASGESRASYQWNPVPNGLAEAHKYIARALTMKARGQRFPFAVEWKQRVVGTTSYSEFQPWEWPPENPLQRADRPDSCEVGYTWYAASAQRTSCNTESKLLLLQHAFETWHVHRVSLKTDQRNERSRNAITRLGCTFEGILRDHLPGADGTLRSSAQFSMIIAEWPAAKQRLLERLATHRSS